VHLFRKRPSAPSDETTAVDSPSATVRSATPTAHCHSALPFSCRANTRACERRVTMQAAGTFICTQTRHAFCGSLCRIRCERALHAHNDLRAKSTGCVHRSVCCQALLSASRVNERAAELRAHNRIRVKGVDVPLPVSDFDELLPLGVPRPLHAQAHNTTQHTRARMHTP
jgi:hypothetical protein